MYLMNLMNKKCMTRADLSIERRARFLSSGYSQWKGAD